jgi:hypothetical protein
MDKSIKRLIRAGAVFLFLVSVLLGFLMLYEPDHVQKKDVKTEPTKELPRQASSPLPVQKEATGTNPANIAPNVVEAVLPSPSEAVTIEPGDPIAEILDRTDLDFPTTVHRLIATLPKLNPEQQAEAAQHIANLSDDALAAQWSQKMIVQSLPQPASEVLFSDLLNRPHELFIPFLSKLADMPQHPQSTQSVEILEVLFGQPPAGTKWEKWVKIKAQEAP